MTLSDTRWLDLDLSDEWLHIYLNAPETCNALSKELIADLQSVLLAVREDLSVRGISLRGRGETFCAGADLKGLSAIRELPPEQAQQAAVAATMDVAQLFDLVHTAPQVVVALVDGAAFAGGLGLACAADFTFATVNSTFAFSETRIGLTPSQVAPYVIGKAGLRNARRLFLTGVKFTGIDALEYGLIDAVAKNQAELVELERVLVDQVLKCAPEAVAATKQVIDAALAHDVQAFQAKAGAHFVQCLISDEGREGIASFFEKRAPSWVPDADSN